MVTIATLVSVEDIVRAFGNHWATKHLNEYVAYQMKPYFHLHIFAYFDFEHIDSPVDGRANAKLLQDKMDILTQRQVKRIELLKTALPGDSAWEALNESCIGKELLDLLAGKLTIKSQFYDTITRSSYISSKIIDEIKRVPQNYILTEINLHS